MKHALNRSLATALLLLAGVPAGAASAAPQPLCQDKIERVERQLEQARDHRETHRARGLRNALEALRDHCTDTGLIKEARQAVREAEQEVSERQADLDEAIADKDRDDIAKRREKLREAEAEWQEAQTQLQQLKLRAKGSTS